MSADDDRRELFGLLEAGIGSRGAALLMTAIPPVGWHELATKNDLVAVRGEMAELRGELKGEMAELKTEIGDLRVEVRSQLPKLIAANIASMIGVAGLVLAAGAIA